MYIKYSGLCCYVILHLFLICSSLFGIQVASHVLMGLTKTTVVLPTMLSPLGKACARMDLTAVHDILLKTGYKDEEGAENEVNRIIYSGPLHYPGQLLVIPSDQLISLIKLPKSCSYFHYQMFLLNSATFR